MRDGRFEAYKASRPLLRENAFFHSSKGNRCVNDTYKATPLDLGANDCL